MLFAVKLGARAVPLTSAMTMAVVALPSAVVVTATLAPPLPAPVIWARFVRANAPPKVTVKVEPEEVTATEPPAPPMVDKEFSALWTAAAVALKASGAVVWPLKVRVNEPEAPETVTV
jgi:hypothetical protein